ncbi:hypothetical protein BY458DRAFT_509266 [Sporodiniella umbellata]|nr:hypothetical protein BY458DRAFT_509266 [Sporodiniella umbellata]
MLNWNQSNNGYTRLFTTKVNARSSAHLFGFLKYSFVFLASLILVFFTFCQLQMNVRVYFRNWLSNAEAAYTAPLAKGCFDLLPKNSPYWTGRKEYTYDLSPGFSLMEEDDCYQFASTIQPSSTTKTQVIFHAYWRADLAPIGPKQVATLRSFFATQSNSSVLYLWSNGDLSKSEGIQYIQSKVGSRLETRFYDAHKLAQGTPVSGSKYLSLRDELGYLDGDLLRLLVVYQYGGVWFDMDALFVRDLSPLLEQEWLQQWDCYLPNGFPFNGAFMRFYRHSPYVCEMLSEIATGPSPRPDTFDWGGYMYYRIYRRLLYHGIRPWSVLPWCFTDSMLCSPENSMPNAFEEASFSAKALMSTFAYHWHNQWKKQPGSLFRFLNQLHQNTTGW